MKLYWLVVSLPCKMAVSSAFAIYHRRASKPLLLTTCTDQAAYQSIRKAASTQQTLLLNQRKLKQLPRNQDSKQVLQFLAECYPHLSPPTVDSIVDTAAPFTYEQLLSFLYKESISNSTNREIDELLIIDGRFITSVIDMIRDSPNAIATALQVLKLCVDGVIQNRQIYYADGKISDDDNSELRQIYKATISLLGHSSKMPSLQNKSKDSSIPSRLMLHLLHHHMPKVAEIRPETEIYHAVLNALGRCGECDKLLGILDEMEHMFDRCQQLQLEHCGNDTSTNINGETTYINKYPPIDRMAYQTAASSLSKHGHVGTAITLVDRMKERGILPDSNCYNMLLIGIAKEAGRENSVNSLDENIESANFAWHKVALSILSEMEDQGLIPTEQAYNSAISACAKERAWKEAARIETKEQRPSSQGSIKFSKVSTTQNQLSAYFTDLECYKKVGKGKDSYWEVGSYKGRDTQKIMIGVQPHRNPVRNGLSLVFYDDNRKLGRLLLKNAPCKHNGSIFSSIVGMEVNKSLRGQGLSKLIVAIWLKICLSTNAYPRAALINKPLISLVLMKFGFVPQEGGACVELIRLKSESSPAEINDTTHKYNPSFGLYSSSKKSLQGVFSERVLRSQNIAVLDHSLSLLEQGRGTTIYIKTTFEHPLAISSNTVDYKPPIELKQKVKEVTETSTSGSRLQRKILEDQLNEFLDGQLTFFESDEQLQLAFSKFITCWN
jgi:pentatricopeptide repeat protein